MQTVKKQVLQSIAACLAVAILGIAAPSAVALSFNFSFSDTNLGDGDGGTLFGVINGLQDNTANQSAPEVIVTKVVRGGTEFTQGTGNYASFADRNFFTVSNGVITSARFRVLGATLPGCNPSCDLLFRTVTGTEAFFNANGGAQDITSQNPPSTLNFTPVPVPFGFSPTWGLLLLGGLWGSDRLRREWATKQTAESSQKVSAPESEGQETVI